MGRNLKMSMKMSMHRNVVLLGINHRTAPVEVREKLAFTQKELEDALLFSQERQGLLETVIISTCNRTEVYGVVDDPEQGRPIITGFLTGFKKIDENQLKDCFYYCRGQETVEHLFRVSAGLDSMVIGETQVLGQVKEAYQKSMDLGRVDTVFHGLFRQALGVGKKIHRETCINDHAASVSYVAVNLAQKIFPRLPEQKVMVLGAGEMAQLTLKHLCEGGVKDLIIVNRNQDQARQLARDFGGRVVGYDFLLDMMGEADIVISSTSAPHFILTRDKVEAIMGSRKSRKLFIIDIAVPRDVDPRIKEIGGVYLYNIDDLQAVLEDNLRERKLAARKAEKIIAGETREFLNWLQGRQVVPLITALRDKADRSRQEHLERSLEKLKGLTDKEKKVVENLSKNIMNSILRDPVLQLKEVSTREDLEGCIFYLCRLFGLELEDRDKAALEKLNRG